jgi:hypothetical protein
MSKSVLRGFSAQFNRLISQYWIAPLDTLLYEMVGLNQSSRWHAFRIAITWIKDLGRLVYTRCRVNVSRWDGPEWTVIYISDDTADSEKELQYLFFSGTPIETKLGRAFIWQLSALIRQFVEQDCLVICDINRLIKWRFQGMYCVRIFPRLRALLHVPTSMDSFVKSVRELRRRELSKARKQGFGYMVSRELEDFELFYHQMYVPFINERYRERAHIRSYEAQREVFEKRGKLLCVKYQNDIVTAYLGTLRRFGRTFSALLMGVHQDHTVLVKKGVITALYWHVVNWAHSNQLSVVDFGIVRARLNDGLFAFKRQLGMWFECDVITHTIWTFIGRDLPLPLVRRLNELAFIAEAGKEYQCVVFESDGASLSEQELAQREKIAAQAGLNGLLVLRSLAQ